MSLRKLTVVVIVLAVLGSACITAGFILTEGYSVAEASGGVRALTGFGGALIVVALILGFIGFRCPQCGSRLLHTWSRPVYCPRCGKPAE
ncbi:MAG: hypothetical protein LBK23_07650, partial [Oscillospiraceae bacterium]|nr:hypothetical protein [Oscillospiraceae bacterium]